MLGDVCTQISLNHGLAVTDQSHGHLALLILPIWIFFFRSYVKDRIYQNPIHDLATLRTCIVEAVETVDVDIL